MAPTAAVLAPAAVAARARAEAGLRRAPAPALLVLPLLLLLLLLAALSPRCAALATDHSPSRQEGAEREAAASSPHGALVRREATHHHHHGGGHRRHHEDHEEEAERAGRRRDADHEADLHDREGLAEDQSDHVEDRVEEAERQDRRRDDDHEADRHDREDHEEEAEHPDRRRDDDPDRRDREDHEEEAEHPDRRRDDDPDRRDREDPSALQRAALGSLVPVDGLEEIEVKDDDADRRHHLLRTNSKDYRPDVQRFLEAYASNPCPLPRASHRAANKVWRRTLKHNIEKTREDPVIKRPWVGPPQRRPMDWDPAVDGSAYELARRGFSRDMFKGPGVIEGIGRHWPARHLWRSKEALVDRLHGQEITISTFVYPDAIFDATGVPSMDRPEWKEESLARYVHRNHSNRNLFFFINEPEEPFSWEEDLADEHRSENWTTNKKALEVLRPDARPLPAFAASEEEKHAVLAIDGVGSSHGLHRHGPVWQTQVLGRKAWFLLPPSVPGGTPDDARQGTHGDLQDRTPVVNGRLFSHPDACEFLWSLPPPPGAKVCIVHPGETLLLPEEWWHGTCGLDELTAAMGGWLEDRRHLDDDDDDHGDHDDDPDDRGDHDDPYEK